MSVIKYFFAKDTESHIVGKERIAKCDHCGKITRQRNNVVLLQKCNDWICLNCGTYSHIDPCTCGDCKSHKYKATGFFKKDICEPYDIMIEN